MAYEIDPQADVQGIFSLFRRVCGSILQGAAIASLAIFIYRRWRGIRFPTEAGHCLLLIFGLVVLYNLIARAILRASLEDDLVVYRVHAIVSLMFRLITALLYGLAAWKLPVSKNWKLMLAAMAVKDIAMTMMMAIIYFSFGSFFYGVYIALNLIQVIILSIVVSIDVRRRIHRDWLHWTGVALLYGLAGMVFVNFLYYLFNKFLM